MRNLTLFFALAVSIPAFAAPFTTVDQRHEPAPTGHLIGKDNYVSPTSSRNVFHHPGEDCGRCHKPGGKASNFDFSMAGTIYTDRTGRTPLEGAEIILRDVNGKVISMTSNAAGNFATQATVGSDPQAWSTASPGPTVADPLGHAATWRYKSWVKLGEYESPMVTMAGVGSTTVNYPRMGCGMHHGPTGSRGALNLGTSTLISYPATGTSYKQHIQPILLNRCKACHIPSDNTNGPNATYPTKNDTAGGTVTASSTVKYNGNLDLATYAGSSKKSTTYSRDKVISDVVNTVNPDQSGLLSWVVQGSTSHSGGWFWKTTDPDYKVIRQWISEGAQNN
ncbi:MAG: hypothetical protein A2V79_00505 [Betaproteobacteria bacterium RBG_16_56_24]|nr:MAG: hypothetical protein A2V79_00505 [Betaproteobacteria bacterium RBG_16_56_24]